MRCCSVQSFLWIRDASGWMRDGIASFMSCMTRNDIWIMVSMVTDSNEAGAPRFTVLRPSRILFQYLLICSRWTWMMRIIILRRLSISFIRATMGFACLLIRSMNSLGAQTWYAIAFWAMASYSLNWRSTPSMWVRTNVWHWATRWRHAFDCAIEQSTNESIIYRRMKWMLWKANLVVGNLEAWVAVRPEHNKTNEKVIQFFSFSYIFWDDIGSFFFNLFSYQLLLLDVRLEFIGFKNSFCVSKSCK